jgi:hypothetical protein
LVSLLYLSSQYWHGRKKKAHQARERSLRG